MTYNRDTYCIMDLWLVSWMKMTSTFIICKHHIFFHSVPGSSWWDVFIMLLSCPHIQCTGRPVVVLKQWIFRTIRSCGFPQDAGGDCGYPSAYDGVAWFWVGSVATSGFLYGSPTLEGCFVQVYPGIKGHIITAYAWIQVPCFFFRSPINSLSIWIGSKIPTCFEHIVQSSEVFVVGAQKNKTVDGGNERIFGLNVTLGVIFFH